MVGEEGSILLLDHTSQGTILMEFHSENEWSILLDPTEGDLYLCLSSDGVHYLSALSDVLAERVKVNVGKTPHWNVSLRGSQRERPTGD